MSAVCPLPVRAVFFDIDGTLLSFETHRIPPSAVEAIHQLKERGVHIFIATGRPFCELPDLQGLSFDGYITLNGAYCQTGTGRVIHKHAIPRQDAEALLRYIDTVERFPCTFMCADGVFINYIDDKVQEMSRLVSISPPPVRDLHELLNHEVFEIDIYVDEAREADLIKNVLSGCDSTRWSPLFADINARGSSKQTGMDHILNYFGIDRSQTMAFGDGGNDIPMLKHAAIGVAMGNAGDRVKAIADYITAAVDEDGIAWALSKFGLTDEQVIRPAYENHQNQCRPAAG